jgi:hypothetical protein
VCTPRLEPLESVQSVSCHHELLATEPFRLSQVSVQSFCAKIVERLDFAITSLEIPESLVGLDHLCGGLPVVCFGLTVFLPVAERFGRIAEAGMRDPQIPQDVW